MPFEYIENINPEEFRGLVAEETAGYLIYMRLHYSQIAREAAAERDMVYGQLEGKWEAMRYIIYVRIIIIRHWRICF
jgi:hypothetical protein